VFFRIHLRAVRGVTAWLVIPRATAAMPAGKQLAGGRPLMRDAVSGWATADRPTCDILVKIGDKQAQNTTDELIAPYVCPSAS
jgi:hypothetical protein